MPLRSVFVKRGLFFWVPSDIKTGLFYGIIGLFLSILGFVSCSKETADHVAVAITPIAAGQAQKAQLEPKP